MDQLLGSLNDIIASVTKILGVFVAFLGAYLFALTVSMIIWTFRDIRSRSRDIFAQALAVVLVVVFNIAGLLLYFILRPRETLSEKYERELAEEAMLQDIEERQVCPTCHHKITAEYLVCPNCHAKLHKKCDNCGRVLNLKWSMCPYCATPQSAGLGRVEIPPAPPARRRESPAPLKLQPAAVPSTINQASVTTPPESRGDGAPPTVSPEAS